MKSPRGYKNVCATGHLAVIASPNRNLGSQVHRYHLATLAWEANTPHKPIAPQIMATAAIFTGVDISRSVVKGVIGLIRCGY